MSRLVEQLDELGVEVDAQLFELALTHRSYAYEHGGIASNERLEFLGDAVLQIVVTEHIYRSYPHLAEGALAKLRASVVSTHALAGIARSLDIGSLILLGKGELATNGRDKDSILADTTEALIGAIHLSAGAAASALVIHHIFDPVIAEAEERGEYTDHKTALQEACARRGLPAPIYEITGSGPDHLREFAATVLVAGEPLGRGAATSKKRAQQVAAREAYRGLTGA